MTASPLVLPPGLCLTDIWPNLHGAARRRWLAVVAAEARAVRNAARAAAAATPPWNAAGATSVHALEQAAIVRRRAIIYQDEGYGTITQARRAGWNGSRRDLRPVGSAGGAVRLPGPRARREAVAQTGTRRLTVGRIVAGDLIVQVAADGAYVHEECADRAWRLRLLACDRS